MVRLLSARARVLLPPTTDSRPLPPYHVRLPAIQPVEDTSSIPMLASLIHLPLLPTRHVESREPAAVAAAGIDADQVSLVENIWLWRVAEDSDLS
jgi:hypothetical protein